MIVVVTRVWSKDDANGTDGYVRKFEKFLGFREQQQRLRGRRLMRGLKDRTHFTNLRFIDSLDDYQALTQREGYPDHLMAMFDYLNPTSPIRASSSRLSSPMDDCRSDDEVRLAARRVSRRMGGGSGASVLRGP